MDASGNRTNFTDERGYSVGYAYDNLDRLTSVLYSENAGNASYFYDNAGNRNDKEAFEHTGYEYHPNPRAITILILEIIRNRNEYKVLF